MSDLARSFNRVSLASLATGLLMCGAGTGAVGSAATTALIMGGTGHPLSTGSDTVDYVSQYLRVAVHNFITPASTSATGIPSGPYNAVAVITPEEFAPNDGSLTFDQSVTEGVVALDNCIKATSCAYNTDVGSTAPQATDTEVVFGYSQSATIATFEKRNLAVQYPTGTGPDVSFVLIANGNRPNGGFLARGPVGVTIPMPLTFGGATFSGPTPTDTQYATVDIARQYEGWSDFPVNPLNGLAVANAMMGLTLLHTSEPGYAAISLDDPSVINQGSYGDTTYYLATTEILPLLMPLEQVPVIGYALADSLDPTLRVLVEAGYDRSISPGVPTSWDPLYTPKLTTLAADLAAAVPAGADNGMEDLFGTRPLGTQRPGPLGVGGGSSSQTSSTATVSVSSAASIEAVPESAGVESVSAAVQSAAEPAAKTSASPGANVRKPAPARKSAATSDSKPARHRGR